MKENIIQVKCDEILREKLNSLKKYFCENTYSKTVIAIIYNFHSMQKLAEELKRQNIKLKHKTEELNKLLKQAAENYADTCKLLQESASTNPNPTAHK